MLTAMVFENTGDVAMIDKAADATIVNEYLTEVLTNSRNPVKKIAEKYGDTVGRINSIVQRNNDYIKQTIDSYMRELHIDKLKILAELRSIAFFNLQDFADFDGEVLTAKSFDELPDNVKSVIKEIEVVENTKLGTRTTHFKFYDKQKALNDLRQIASFGTEHKVAVSGLVKHEHRRMFDDVYEVIKQDGVNQQAA